MSESADSGAENGVCAVYEMSLCAIYEGCRRLQGDDAGEAQAIEALEEEVQAQQRDIRAFEDKVEVLEKKDATLEHEVKALKEALAAAQLGTQPQSQRSGTRLMRGTAEHD